MLLYVICIIIIILWIYCRKTYCYFKNREVNHLPPIPIFGTMAKAVFQKEHAIIASSRPYFAFSKDRFVGDYEFFKPIVVIRDPNILRQICIKEFDKFPNRRLFTNEDDPIFAKSLFGLKDQKWHSMRSILSPAFTGHKLRGMVPLIQECSKNLIEYLNSGTKVCFNDHLEVNISDLLTRYTNDVIATCAFGLQINSITDEDNLFYKMAKKLTSFTFFEVLKSFVVVGLPFVNKFLDISLFSKEAVCYLTHIILNTMKNRDESNSFRPDLIQILLEAKKGTFEDENRKGEKDADHATGEEFTYGKGSSKQVWKDDELVAQALIFFFAGFDTVASAVTLLLHEMSLNLDIQSKVRQEVDDYYERLNGKVDYENINQIKYLDLVLTEGLRKWPPAPIMERVCKNPFNLGKPHDKALNDFYVEKDVVVSIPVWAIHHDPEYYPEPDKFDPERFSDENIKDIKPFTYLPFGLGPRHCIGSRFAMIEIKILLLELLRNFEFAPGSKTDVLADLDPTSFSPRMNGGHYLKVMRRKKL